MTRAPITVAPLATVIAVRTQGQAPAPTPAPPDISTVAGQRAIVDANCAASHQRAGEVLLERHAEAQEKAILKVRRHCVAARAQAA